MGYGKYDVVGEVNILHIVDLDNLFEKNELSVHTDNALSFMMG